MTILIKVDFRAKKGTVSNLILSQKIGKEQ